MAANAPARAIGIDGCPGGWIGAILDANGPHWLAAGIDEFRHFTDRTAPDGVIGVDMPIGLVDHGWRACDLLAKTELGRAHSRVFLTPPRPVVELGHRAPNDVVQQLSRSLTGQGVSRQALALSPRILDVDRCLPDERLIEVHPEISFAEMTGGVLASKKSPIGEEQRLSALAIGLGNQFDDLTAFIHLRPRAVPINDALDALAVLWTALRYRLGRSRSLPEQAECEGRGVPMRIVV
jgi:predicted RNase H-like nuclease